jgi:hypothetical protein
MYHALESIPNLKPSEVAPFLNILEHVRDSGLLDRFDVDISARLADIQTRVRELAADAAHHKYGEFAQSTGANCALPLLLLSDEIEKQAKLLDKRFPEPLLGYVTLAVATLVPVR